MPERANAAKLGVNLVLAVQLEALGEAFTLGEGYGVEAACFLDILEGSTLKSPVVEAYGKRIAEQRFESGFRLELGAKDVRLALEAAEQRAIPTPIARALLERFVAAMAEGHAEEDWSAVGRISSHESHA
jgi:3-hydroxyisobutyrate dehydrogenase-like beta-hydroxyacid dehydrogenase